MTCESYQQNLSRVIDNELGEPECAEVFAHMGSCGECRKFFRTCLQIHSAVETWEVPEPTGPAEPFASRTSTRPGPLSFIPSYWKLRETNVSLRFAVAAVIIAMVGTLAVSSLFMRQNRENHEGAERVVYGYILPTVYVQPQQIQQHTPMP